MFIQSKAIDGTKKNKFLIQTQRIKKSKTKLEAYTCQSIKLFSNLDTIKTIRVNQVG